MMKHHKIAPVSAATLAFAMAVAAQSASAQTAPAAPADAGTPSTAQPPAAEGQLQDIIVTAERREGNIMKTPVSVTAITGTQLESKGITNLQDMVHDAPGFQVNAGNSGPNDLNLQMRGIGPSGSLANVDQSVGIYIDGLYYARAAGSDLNFVDVNRVEVLKGPQGTLFGRNTIAGAISVTTNRPTDRFEGSVMLGTGNYGRISARAIVNIPISDTLQARVVYDHDQHDGFGYDLYLKKQSQDSDQNYGRLSLLWQPSTNFEFYQTVDYRDMGYSSPDYVLFYLDPAIASASNYAKLKPYLQPIGSRDNYSGLNVHAHARAFDYTGTATVKAGFATFKSITGYRDINVNEPTDVDATPNAITDYPEYPMIGHQFSEELQAYGDMFDGRLSWIAGLYYFDEHIDVNGPNPALSGTVYSYGSVENMHSNSKSVFSQLTFKITPTLRLTGGARYVMDRRSLTQHDANVTVATGVTVCSPNNVNLTPAPDCRYTPPQIRENYVPWTIGVDFSPTPEQFYYAKVTRGYRSGGEQQRYIEDPTTGTVGTTTVAGTALPFPSFDTETALTYEVGGKLSLFDKHLRLTAAAYLTHYDAIQTNAASYQAAVQVPILHFYNIGSATIKGVELEATALIGGITFTQTLSVIDPKFTSGPYTGTPYISSLIPSKYVTSTSVDAPIRSSFALFDLHADFGWQSESFSYPVFNINAANGGAYYLPSQINAIRNPAYGILNMRLDITPHALDHVQLSLWVKNLANQFYFAKRASNYTQGYDAGFPGDPRTFGVRATYTF